MKTYILGTAIKLTTILSSTVDSIAITIMDEGCSKKIDSVAMTADSDTVYHYVYQSSKTDTVGTYIAVIEAVSGDKTSVSRTTFEMIDRCDI
jgi:hypothetical protein